VIPTMEELHDVRARLGRAGRPWHRVHVERRRNLGMVEVIEVAMSGLRWTYWCTCDATPHKHPTQSQALAAGLTHLSDVHGQRAPR